MNTPREMAHAVKPITVVLAEDHRAIGKLLVGLLESRGTYRVISHETCAQGIPTICREHKPQVLILDLELPDGHGIQVARDVAQASPDTSILLFSGYIDAQTVCDALRAGVCGILEKTAGVDVFQQAVAAVALGRNFYGPEVMPLMPRAVDLLKRSAEGGLTSREREILGLIASGHSSRRIATQLKISERTVGNHRANMMSKLGAHNAADLTREALRMGLVGTVRRQEVGAVSPSR